jgi:glycosyltransferase involved in cell wall biosynthesis
MEIIILHYHLNPGGVTRIIESQIQALQIESKETKITVICGNANGRKEIEGCPVLTLEILDYLEAGLTQGEITNRVALISEYLTSVITDQTIIHCHNLNLGKNPALLMSVFDLASKGVSIVSHCHDFAEDRPFNMDLLQRLIPKMTSISIRQILYPDFKKVQFAVLNSCDFNRLIAEGIDIDKINLLPNPVVDFNIQHENRSNNLKVPIERTSARKLCVYPVRAITRKNIGELVLLAILFNDSIQFAITLPPRNPIEVPQYKRWKDYCQNNEIDVLFEVGEHTNYEDFINISDFCISTSLQEGFGMSFLEPWLAGKPVVGRELPCVINDFKEQGLKFPALYDSIKVEVDGRHFDFKDLSVEDKEQLLTDILEYSERRQKIFDDNPGLRSLFNTVEPETIAFNQNIIRAKFSIEEYGKRLFAIYRKISR